MAAVAPEGGGGGGGGGFKLITSYPEICTYGCCCFEYGCRDIPSKDDKNEFCVGRVCCNRAGYNLADPGLSCQYLCLGFNAKKGFGSMAILGSLTEDEGFKPYIPKDLPTFHECCAEQCCCMRAQMCQPCFGMCGDTGDKWETLVQTKMICMRGQSFEPKGFCQYFCLRWN